jgi:hypothetical protein
MRFTLTFLMSLALSLFLSCSQSPFSLNIGETGVFNIVEGTDLIRESEDTVFVHLPIELVNAAKGMVELSVMAEDMLGNPVLLNYIPLQVEIKESGLQQIIDLPLELKNGFYRLRVIAVNNGKQYAMDFTEIAVVPPQIKTLRPNSFFASNTSDIKLGNDLELLSLLGIKVQRTHFYPDVTEIPEIPSDKPFDFDYSKLDNDYRQTVEKGIWVLPIAGYAFKGTRSEMAIKMNNHGPPRHFGEFVLSWKEIIKRYPEIRAWELWNEPWIFEWTWAATAADYREMHEMWCREALDADPELIIVAGNSCMFVEDNIEPYPHIWKGLMHATSHHPYANAEARSLRHNAQIRSIDYGYLVNSRMKLPYYYITEGGSLYSTPTHIAQANSDIEDLYRKLIRREEGTQIIELFDRYRHQYVQHKFDIENTISNNPWNTEKEILKKQIHDLAKNNQTRQIINKLFDAFAISTEDEIGIGNNSNVNASKVVQYIVIGALHGVYQNNIQWNLGYGPAWTRSNMTMAVCHYFLEDRPIVADIWPETSLVWGAIFADTRHITSTVRALPRAGDISARWNENVPEDARHTDVIVAVVFSLTGSDPGNIDTQGQLVIEDVHDIRAFDCTGREIHPQNNRLAVPLNEYATYLTSEILTVEEFHRIIANAKKENLTALSLYAGSLTRPAQEQQVLTVRIDNHINRTVAGSIKVVLEGNTIGEQPFEALTGLNSFEIVLENFNPLGENIYPVEIRVESDAGNYFRNQMLQRALFAKSEKIIDGRLDDWKQSIPVVIDSDMMKKGVELTQYLFNPHLQKPGENQNGGSRVAARIYTAYDDHYVYIAAEVLEDTLLNAAGNPAMVNGVETGFLRGLPGGLNHPRYTGDLFMFGFGFRERVPGFGRQMDDPLAWKGQFYDTDYLYLAYTSTQGNQLIRQWGADTPRQNGFQTDPVETIGSIEGAKIVIERDPTTWTTVYEIAIPRSELALFNENERSLRFGFVLINNEGAGKSGKLEWAEAAGVFDYWLNSGSFAPTWDQFLPLQTEFGIVNGRP